MSQGDGGEEERAGGARGGFLCSSLQRSKAIKLSCCSVFGVLGDYDLDYYRNFHVHVKTERAIISEKSKAYK